MNVIQVNFKQKKIRLPVKQVQPEGTEQRLQRIRASLERINRLVAELKLISQQERRIS